MTRGGVDLGPVLASVASFGQVIVWDNSQEKDRKVYGRYLATRAARHDHIFVCDDDTVVDAVRLCNIYAPGQLLCNVSAEKQKFYPRNEGIQLVGWGAIFPKSMVDFSPYLDRYPPDELFLRECDRIFTYLNRNAIEVADIGVQELAHAHDHASMTQDGRHWEDLKEIQRRLRNLWN